MVSPRRKRRRHPFDLQLVALGCAALLDGTTVRGRPHTAAPHEATAAAPRCNITVPTAELPCRLPRCRRSGPAAQNVTERGMFYRALLIDRFIEEWDDYQGFLGPETAFFVHLLSSIQADLGVAGTVGEIGVAAGKSFVTLAFTRRGGEGLFVCDIFAGSFGDKGSDVTKDGVEVEFDNAAGANLPMFMDTLFYAGINATEVVLHDGPSFGLSDRGLLMSGSAPFRLFHVDGGHFLEAALHDLRMAACTLAPGGVIMLDDLNNGIFPGVQEAFHHFMVLDRPSMRPNLVPFLHVGRLYLTDREFAQEYRDRLRPRLPKNAYWKQGNVMYGEEVLQPGNLAAPETWRALRELVQQEELRFPWPARVAGRWKLREGDREWGATGSEGWGWREKG